MSQWKKARHCLPTRSRLPSQESVQLGPRATTGCSSNWSTTSSTTRPQQWFDEHGWTAVATPLADYLREVGRPVPGPDIEAGPMIARNTLVRAVKQ